jgi:UDP-3-O-[3-hydroxymyristoyl] glucosamine N-acyltransferase
VAENPYLYFARVTQLWRRAQQQSAGPRIHPSAVVDPDAHIDPSAQIGPLCVVERGARIGAQTVLKSRVTVSEDCVVGERCILHPGVVIGADGFGFAKDGERWEKIEQLGAVRIGNDVEIGANTCIDRGALSDTVIEDGVKLDNLIQIAHNVRVGDHTVMAAQVGVSGSTLIGRHVQIGGQAGLIGHLAVADGTMIAGSTNVIEDTQPRSIQKGYVATPHLEFKRIQAVTQRLPELKRKVTDLEARLAALEQGAGAKEGRTP